MPDNRNFRVLTDAEMRGIFGNPPDVVTLDKRASANMAGHYERMHERQALENRQTVKRKVSYALASFCFGMAVMLAIWVIAT